MKAATPASPSIASVPLFVYGTLLSPVVMESLIQRRVTGRPVRLLPSSYVPSSSTATAKPASANVAMTGSTSGHLRYDYSRHPVRNAVYPGLVHWDAKNEDASIIATRNHVCGLLYSHLTNSEMEQLDAFEGDQYRKELCYVQLLQANNNDSNIDETLVAQDNVIQAMVYIWSYPLTDLDLSKDWSYATFEEQHLATYL